MDLLIEEKYMERYEKAAYMNLICAILSGISLILAILISIQAVNLPPMVFPQIDQVSSIMST